MSDFKDRVEAVVSKIPEGRVMTYGQLAALCGNPKAARIVGGIAHFGAAYLHTTPDCPFAKRTAPLEFETQHLVETSGSHSPYHTYGSLRSSVSPRAVSSCEGCGGPVLPWHRVVNKQGGLASGYPGGKEGHKKHLEAEGLKVGNEYRVNVERLLWRPLRVDER